MIAFLLNIGVALFNAVLWVVFGSDISLLCAIASTLVAFGFLIAEVAS